MTRPPPAAAILVVDDEPLVRDVLRHVVEGEGWDCLCASNGVEAWELFSRNPTAFAAVVSDIRMPGGSGLELCRRIRTISEIPLIVVSGLAADADVLAAFEAGADDYVTKPLKIAVFTARLQRAVERSRAGQPPVTDVAAFGDVSVDFANQAVTKNGRSLPVTGTGFRILVFLLANKDHVVSSTQILRHVWGEHREADLDMLRAAVMRLRRIIEDDPRNPRYIMTHKGLGYRLADPGRS